MRNLLKRHKFTVHLIVVLLFVGASLGMYFAPGHGALPEVLLAIAMLSAVLALGV